ncbi:MAG: NAD-dependent epimerase/dehydratase family protein [Chloracidobacterium sp.]|nr:NAD-dependent epimerase/dehydratase family protein [Chloracidobacterium sp.]MCO5333081.1 NAD-dependent epimerase/dehydratase family protein [Pyrinomonadaceae bacterium]
MKVLVTGGSGYLGTHVRRFFGADDLSRRSGKDVLIRQDAAIASEYDLVIHMAANLDRSSAGEEKNFETQVAGTINILRSMREGAAFIYLSTKDIYGRFADNYFDVPETVPVSYSGQSSFEWSKFIAEKYVEYYANARGFRSCIFRLSSAYAPMSEGNRPSFAGHYANAINLGEAIRLPAGGTPIRDILHVDDFARACSAFFESVIRHGLYNIGGGRANAMSLTDLITKMEEVSGLSAVIDTDHPLPAPVPLNYVTDTSLIMLELDWEPQIAVEDGLRTLFSAHDA